MFSYRPPKGSVWGHSFGRDEVKARPKHDEFVNRYFDFVDTDQTSAVEWKSSVLPRVDWPELFLRPDQPGARRFVFLVIGNRVAFPLGIVFPLSPVEPASYEFLRQFSSDAPFKMKAKHFSVGVMGKKSYLWRKPNAEIAAKLEKFLA